MKSNVVWGLVLFLSLTLGTTAATRRQTPQGKQEEKKGILDKAKDKIKDPLGKKEEQNKKAAERAEKKLQKQERQYQEIFEYANKKYDEDPEFKGIVDEAYEDLNRMHSQYAFAINTMNTRDELITYMGDKVKTEDTLYDNPLVQDYINRVGQSLVPKDSPFRYAFKVVLNPIPEARSLSTGTVYLSTGLLSLIDNEAQLAYILGHEIAHIHKEHWKQDALVVNGVTTYNKEREKIAKGVGILATIIGGGIGAAATKSIYRTTEAALLSGLGAYTALKFLMPEKQIAWARLQEDEADKFGLDLMFQRKYDPVEARQILEKLDKVSKRDTRTGLGFIADQQRVLARTNYVANTITSFSVSPGYLVRGADNLRRLRQAGNDDHLAIPGKAMGMGDMTKRTEEINKSIAGIQPEIDAQVANGGLSAGGGEFRAVMADLKRDNGIRAFYFDMFDMAYENLSESIQIRSNDPYSYFYFGKVLHQTARMPADKAKALESFRTAIKLDQRGVLAEPHLYLALAKMAEKNPGEVKDIAKSLQRYVEVFQQEHAGALPPNMDVIYAYLKEARDDEWVVRPAQNVANKGIELLGVTNGATRVNATPVLNREPQPTPQPQPPSPPTPTPVRKKN